MNSSYNIDGLIVDGIILRLYFFRYCLNYTYTLHTNCIYSIELFIVLEIDKIDSGQWFTYILISTTLKYPYKCPQPLVTIQVI